MRIATLALAAVVLALAGEAQAQVAVGGAVGASTQSVGTSEIPFLGPAFGGTTVGALGMIDFPFKPRATLGVEASLAGAISGDQSQRTSTTTNAFLSRHRDSVFSAVLKVGTSAERTIHAAVAVGAGAAYRRTAREGTTASIFPPSVRSPFSDTVSDVVFAYLLGGDVDVRVTPRIRVLAVARWHRLLDDDRLSAGVAKRGVASTVVRVGAGLKVRF